MDAVISVDTMSSEIAEEALKRGVEIINDISGFTADSKMIEVVADYGCPAVVMASIKVPGDPLGMDSIIEALDSIISTAEAGGIGQEKSILDPAIGRWTDKSFLSMILKSLIILNALKFLKNLYWQLSQENPL